MPSAPFRQLPFDQVPEGPRVPHRWRDTQRRDLTIRTDDLGEVRIAVREYGPTVQGGFSGPSPVFLVHGMGTTGYSWRYVLETLGQRHLLIIPDLPGAGDSDHPDVYLGPDVMARALLAIIKARGFGARPVIANSMGGYIAMRAAMLDPAAMSRLVNLHSPGVPTFKMGALRWAMRLLPSWRILNRMIARDPERWVHENVHYFDEELKSREEHRVYAAPLREVAGRRTYYRQLRDTLDTRDMKQFVRALRATPFPIPLQLVYAPSDPIVPAAIGDRLHALVPQAQFVRLATGSHFAHVDAPSQFLDAVTPFLSAGP
ncbi:MAG TPA: alpha/beta hydrolase [Kofleriaceae bacterium]